MSEITKSYLIDGVEYEVDDSIEAMGGDLIIVTNKVKEDAQEYEDGDLLKVAGVYDRTIVAVRENGDDYIIAHYEYAVVVSTITDSFNATPTANTIDISDKALIFVQDGTGDHFTVYQDGEKVEGIMEIMIRGEAGLPTTHEIEYATGRTKKREC